MRTLAALMLLAAPLAADDAADLKALAGTWIAESFEIEGADMTENFKNLTLTIDGKNYTVTVGELKDVGTLKIDSSKTPKTMDVTGTEGTNKGRTYVCIYELKDGKLTICYSMDDKNRPAKFETAKNSMTMLAVYRKK